MVGAIIGDIAGSRFEWENHKSKDFDFFHAKDSFTDDTVLTLAIAEAILQTKPDHSDLSELTAESMRKYGHRHTSAGYGGLFRRWLLSSHPEPYNSFGNGSAMRVSACGWAAQSLEEALNLAETVSAVTHDHPEGIKGAQAIAAAIYLARTGADKAEIRRYIQKNFYPVNFTLDEIRPAYGFDATCQGSVPQALEAFFEAVSFEDAIRNAISLGGDSDTIAAMAGSVAEAYYGVPADLRTIAESYLTPDLRDALAAFEKEYPPRSV